MVKRYFNWRLFFWVFATAIVAATVYYAGYLAKKIEKEERQRIEEWVKANRVLQINAEINALNLANLILVNNEDLPLIATDEKGEIIDYRNLDTQKVARQPNYLQSQLVKLKSHNKPIMWAIGSNPPVQYRVYYGHSQLLRQVRYYPLIQLLVVALFLALVISSITTHNRSTQNQVWAGMAKETAHQLGTPLTSLQGWVELMKENEPANKLVGEMEKDLNRLILVSERFGKIGSSPHFEPTDLGPLLTEMVVYMKRRAPASVIFETRLTPLPAIIPVSPTLLNWVFENLLKNALDALDGRGTITVFLQQNEKQVIIDVSDTGKGIPAENLKRVFSPGFTTKKRGWGLGLSLCKRIVEQYHKGQLFVKSSDPGQGTTFRVQLPAQKK